MVMLVANELSRFTKERRRKGQDGLEAENILGRARRFSVKEENKKETSMLSSIIQCFIYVISCTMVEISVYIYI